MSKVIASRTSQWSWLLRALSALPFLTAVACQNTLDQRTTLQVSTTNNSAVKTAGTVAIVYNDSNSTDTTLANTLKALLTTDLRINNAGVSGTETLFNVNLIPQSSVPTIYNASYVVNGNAIILTPGTTIGAYPATSATSAQLAEEQSIVNQNVAIIAMGSATGASAAIALFDDINLHTAWVPAAQQPPSSIGWGLSGVGSDTSVVLVANGSPNLLTDPYVAPSTPTTVVTNSSPQSDTTVFDSGGTVPTKGLLLAQSGSSSSYYTIVRQGRFLQYGLTALPDTVDGKVLFVNLVAYMAGLPVSSY